MSERIEPWDACDVWETKAQYFQWLRGQMRRAWSRHPVKVAYTRSRRVRASVGLKINKTTGIRATVWALPCDICGALFPQNEVEVDHIERAGSFKDWDDCQDWLMGLMRITPDDLQLACKPCHTIKSYAETHCIAFEEARSQKAAIAWLRANTPVEQQEFLMTRGYTASQTSNKEKRRAIFVTLTLHITHY